VQAIIAAAIYWGRRQWMADHPQTMKMFLAALDESLRAINAKPEAGAEALARYGRHGCGRWR